MKNYVRPLYLTIVIGVGLLSLNLMGAQLFPPRGFEGPPSREEQARKFIECFREEFNPTDEQLEKLQSQILPGEDGLRLTVQSMELKKKQLEASLEGDAQESELLQLFNGVEDQRRVLAEAHFRKMLLLRDILTPDQRKKFGNCKKRLGPPAPLGGPEGG